MAKKLGDVLIAMSILLFCISSYSAFLADADNTLDFDTKASQDIALLHLKAQESQDAESGFYEKVTETSSFSIGTDDQQLEDRGSDSLGFTDLVSKNILTKFFETLQEKFPISSTLYYFILSIIGISISVLLIRFIWGENKI